ncbi:hypothetical protein MKX07_007750 [Trichoderma sp. CBMAI-0711]|nr:hypothetical protein MKX07_007750 [Trichoderma sp. CBMAI-0711]
MRPFLTLLLLATEAAGHAIPAVDSNEIAARSTSTYRAPNGVQFAVETGFDHHGGDYKSVTAKSLNDCINVCSTQASCRAVSYSGKTCWLKSSVQPAVANSKTTNAVRSQYVPKPISCPADGSSRVKGPDGRSFTVQCGVDHPKGDLKHVQTPDFANCINLCDVTSGCVAASFRSGTCYLKKSLQPAVAVSGGNTAVLSSMLPTGPVFCPGPNGQVIKKTSGRTFTVFCNADRPGGDLANKALANFGDCVAWCDETKGCAASVFHDGHCWLKSKVTAPTPRTNSQVAVLDSALSPPPSLCPSQNGKQIKESTGRSFTVACNVDRPGGDLASMKLHSFSSCVAWCDQTSGCLAASYHDGMCWLKKTLNKSATRANGQVAVLSSKLPQTSTKVTSTSTKKTTTSTSTKKTTTTTTSSSTKTTTTSTSTSKSTSTTTTASSTSTSSQSSQTSTSASASSSTSTAASSNTSPAATTGPADATSSSSSSSSSSAASTPSTEVPATTSSASSASTTESSADSTSTSTKDASTSVPDATSSGAATTTADDVTQTTDIPGSLDIPAGPLKLPAQPTVTLRPLAPPNIDVSSTDVIKPKEVSQLWFGNTNPPSDASDAVNAPTVRVNMTFQYPSVILDNSANILNIQCGSGSTLSASFNGADAYNAAKQSWAAAEGSSDKLIIVTADPGCSSDGHYVYFVASSISFNDGSKSVSCSGSTQSVADIAQEVGVDFGVIETSTPTLEANPELASAYGCTVPDTSEVRGLPAIYCGPDFDLRLNNKLGYYSVEDADLDATFAAVIPGVSASDIESRGLDRRCWPSWACKAAAWVDNTAKKAYNAVADGAKSIGNDLANIASDLGKDAVKNLSNLGSSLLNTAKNFAQGILAAAIFIVTGDYNRSFDFPISIAPPKSALDDSPWGDGFKFYTWTPDKGDYWNAQDAALDKIKGVVIGEADPEPGVEFWCVDCHVDGKLKLLGSASFSLTSGLTKAQLSLDGSLDAGLYLGMNAFAQWNPKKEYDFLSLGLPGLSIPDIFAIGPVLSLGISVDLDISAVGQYLVGADMQWTSISAKLDVLNPRSSSKSGWTPNIRDTVQADGSLTVNSTLGLPVTLGFGINILKGKYDKEIKLVDTPGVRASLEYDFTNEVNNGEVNTDPEDGCYGIHWSVGMVNTVVLDLSDIKQGTYTLDEYDAPVFASGCVGENLSIAPPATTVAPPSGGTTSVPPSGADCGSLSCPGSDGQTCSSSGAAFQISCGLIYADVLYRVARTNNAAACVNICATDDLCVGANFFGQMFGAMPDCMMYRGGAPSSAAPANIIWSYRKVSSPHKKRIQLLDRAPTTLTTISSISQTSSAGTVAGTATGTASGNVQAKILADTLTRTASPAATSPVTDTSVATATASVTATTTKDASTAATATDATSAATSTSSPDGPHESIPVTLKDATGSLLISPHVNGSIFVSSADSSVSLDLLTNGTTFMADITQPLVVGDSASRILYYFPDTISAVGASRLRMGSWDAIPIGAEMITLFPTKTSTGATVLVPMDSQQNVFYPFVCDIKGQLNKLFLVSDKDTGADTLTDPDLRYTVVGGVAQTCVSLAMVAEHLPGWSPSGGSTPTTATSTKATSTKATVTITP